MKKFMTVILFVTVALTSLFPSSGFCRTRGNLYDELSKMDEVRTYIADVTNASENNNAQLKGLKKILENAFVTRMTINFKVVNDEQEADIIVNSKVVELMWTDKDPIDMLMGLGGIAMDAAVVENYGRMRVIFTVTDGAKGRKLWSKKVQANITDKTMTEEQSIPMLNERIAKMLMRKCFSKNSKRQERLRRSFP